MSEQYTYENYFTPYVKNFAKIQLSDDRRKKLSTAIGLQIAKREKEKGRKLLDIEVNNYRKIYMQTSGDLVLEQHLELGEVVKFDKIFDENRISFINDLLPNKKIDIVTFEYGLFPMVYKKTYRKTIFVCMLNKNEFMICGMASPKLIDMYSKSELVMSPYFRSKGKAAFFGFERLSPITTSLGNFIELIK